MLDQVFEVLKKFEQEKMYGEVVVKFEAGVVVHIKPTESIRPTKVQQPYCNWRKRWGSTN
jgi:hypothetical protein